MFNWICFPRTLIECHKGRWDWAITTDLSNSMHIVFIHLAAGVHEINIQVIEITSLLYK